MENELLGGLKNALERGQSLEQAKQSFINAGYNLNEIESTTSMLSSAQQIQISENKTPRGFSQTIPESMNPQQSQFKHLPLQPNIKKPISKIWIIILILVSSMILISAAIFGLYWDQLFG